MQLEHEQGSQTHAEHLSSIQGVQSQLHISLIIFIKLKKNKLGAGNMKTYYYIFKFIKKNL